jgi:hypothetical protein
LACILQVGAWYLAYVKNDIMFPSSTFIAKSSTVLSIRNLLFLFRFFNFVEFARHFLPLHDLCQKPSKNFLCQILNDFNRLQNFYFGADFGTGHAITYIEREQNLPFMEGSAGAPIIGHVQCSMEHFLTYVSIQLRNLWKRLAGRRSRNVQTNPLA